MKKIVIITDDNSGFTPEESKELGIYLVRMPVLIDGETYYEHENLTTEDFYKFLAQNKDIKTSQPSPGNILKLWGDLLVNNDQIIHMPMSSGLSESCNTAKVLANDEKYKDKVFVVDNHRISITLKRAVFDALNLIKDGKDAKEIKEILEKRKLNSSIYIMVDTLKYLKKGGRVTAAGAALGATFHIKPVLQIEGGKLDAKSKEIGVKKAKIAMIKFIKEDLEKRFQEKNGIKKVEYGIAYTYNRDAALEFANDVIKAFDNKIKITLIDPLSLSVAAHIGPGAIAIAISEIIE